MDDATIISPISESAPVAKTRRPAQHVYARAAMITGGIIIAISVAALIGFALYPLFTGQGLREFVISFIVPFLISLMGIVPGALLYFTGRQVLRVGPGYGAAAVAAVLALPPLAFGITILPRLGVSSTGARAICGIIGALLLLWAISLIRARKSALT